MTALNVSQIIYFDNFIDGDVSIALRSSKRECVHGPLNHCFFFPSKSRYGFALVVCSASALGPMHSGHRERKGHVKKGWLLSLSPSPSPLFFPSGKSVFAFFNIGRSEFIDDGLDARLLFPIIDSGNRKSLSSDAVHDAQ